LAEWCSYPSNKGGMVDSPVILEILAVVGFTVSSVVVTAIRICVWFDRAALALDSTSGRKGREAQKCDKRPHFIRLLEMTAETLNNCGRQRC
jgi:hypothetical protein